LSMGFDQIHNLLNHLETRSRWHQRQQYQQAVTAWAAIVGPVVAAQTRPVTIYRNVLQVATSSASWAQTLVFERKRILKKLNDQIETPLDDIRFSTAQWRAARAAARRDSTSVTSTLWQGHPSRLPQPPQPASPPADSPQAAYENWAASIQARSRHLPLCPRCQCPAPPGELERWSMCATCAAKQW